jgi:hypothetical protein
MMDDARRCVLWWENAFDGCCVLMNDRLLKLLRAND